MSACVGCGDEKYPVPACESIVDHPGSSEGLITANCLGKSTTAGCTLSFKDNHAQTLPLLHISDLPWFIFGQKRAPSLHLTPHSPGFLTLGKDLQLTESSAR